MGEIMEILFRGNPLYSRKFSLEKRQLSLLVNFARNRPDLVTFSAGQEAEDSISVLDAEQVFSFMALLKV